MVIKPYSGRRRKIPVSEMLVHALQARHKVAGDGLYVFPDPRTGTPWGTVNTPFLASFRRPRTRRSRCQDVRHTFATRLVSQGIDQLTVKKPLGHSSTAMMVRYVHPSHENLRRAVQLLPARTAASDGYHPNTMANFPCLGTSVKSLPTDNLGP